MPIDPKGVRNGAKVFWGEIAPGQHLVQFHSDEKGYLDSLEGFVLGGLKAGESVVVIAADENRAGLEGRLAERGIDLTAARARDQYIALDADDTLARFMVDGWPDEELFGKVISDILARAQANKRRARVFGEMVATLWAQGHSGATVRLEHLWNELLRTNSFSLCCAYPRSGFTADAEASFREICAAHTNVVHGNTPRPNPGA